MKGIYSVAFPLVRELIRLLGKAEDGAFVMPKSIADKAIVASNGNPRLLEELLGLKEGSLGDSPIRIDVSPENKIRKT
jgi:hypothetical protein